MPDGTTAAIAAHRIEGDVTDQTSSALAQFLASAKGRAVQITINSRGGAAFAGLACYQQLHAYKGKVTIIIEGIAASAASLIAMGGDEIAIHTGSFIMIHDASGSTSGTGADHRKSADVLERVSAEYRAAYVRRSAKPEADVAAWMSEETWFSAEEAVAAGLADRIIAAPRVAAAADLTNFTNLPAALRAALAQETTMATTPVANPPPAPAVPTPQPATLADLEGIVARSRGRLSSDFIVAQLKGGATLDQVRDAALEAIALAEPQREAGRIEVTRDERETARAGAVEAISAKLLGREPKAEGQMFRGWDMVAIARDRFEARNPGSTRGWSASKIIEVSMASGMHGTSDFPELLRDATNKTLSTVYTSALSPLRQALAQRRTVSNFHPIRGIGLDGYAPLLEVPEHGEVTHGTVGEEAQVYSIGSYGRNMALTFQAMVNDNLGGFQRIIASAGQAAAAAEADRMIALFTANSGAGANLADGNPLFHTSRGNLAGAGGAIDETTLSAGRLAMRSFRSIETNQILDSAPRYLAVSPVKETQAEKVLAALTPGTVSDVNVFSGRLTPLVDPRLTGDAWYLFADPAQFPVFEIAFLDGRTGPTVEDFTDKDVLGVTYRVTHHFGVGVVGWRGAYRNPGA